MKAAKRMVTSTDKADAKLEPLLAKYAKRPRANTHLAMIFNDGKVINRGSQACFYTLNEQTHHDCENYYKFVEVGPKNPLKYVVFNVNSRLEGDPSNLKFDWRQYVSYIVNRSVYADLFITKNPEDVAVRSFAMKTTQPSAVVVQGACAIRYLHEHPAIPKAWNIMVAAGINPDYALIVANACFNKNGWSFDLIRSWHSMFGAGFTTEHLMNFMHRKIDDTLFPMAIYTRYRPLNRPWGPAEYDPYRDPPEQVNGYPIFWITAPNLKETKIDRNGQIKTTLGISVRPDNSVDDRIVVDAALLAIETYKLRIE